MMWCLGFLAVSDLDCGCLMVVGQISSLHGIFVSDSRKLHDHHGGAF